MKRGLSTFIAVVVALTVGYSAAEDLSGHLPSSLQALASLILLIVFFWVVFNLIVKIIYWFVGVTNKVMDPSPGRLNHRQAEIVNRYWITWLLVSLLTTMIYTLLFHRHQWKAALISGAIFTVVVLLAMYNTNHKLMGHTKNDLFKLPRRNAPLNLLQ